MYVCVFIGGKGGWLIQQEPKDNSGHLTGIVCMCVFIGGKGGWHWGKGWVADSARAKGQ